MDKSVEHCPKCGIKNFLVARDTKSTRSCACGETWIPDGFQELRDRLTASEAALAEANAALSGRTVSCSRCNELAKELANRDIIEKLWAIFKTVWHPEKKESELTAELAKQIQVSDSLAKQLEAAQKRIGGLEALLQEAPGLVELSEKLAKQSEDRANKAEAERDALVVALKKIANMDYRGNRSTEMTIAYEALKALKPAPIQDAKVLAREQPCGCIVCRCEDEHQCHGCGAKNCGTHPLGQIPNPVYEEPTHAKE